MHSWRRTENVNHYTKLCTFFFAKGVTSKASHMMGFNARSFFDCLQSIIN